MPVRKREINGNGEPNFTATKDILQKSVSGLDFQLCKLHLPVLLWSLLVVVYLILFLTLFKLSKRCHNIADELVLAGLGRLKEVELDLTIRVVPRQVSGQHVYQIPFIHPVAQRLNLRLIDGLLQSRRDDLVDKEEVHTI